MTQPLEPDIEAYGSDARASALADVLELQAWTSRGKTSMTEAQLVEYIADAQWGRRRAEKFLDVGETGPLEEPTAKDMAAHVLRHLARRAELLGEAYPYALDDRSLVRTDDGLTGYDVVLGVAMAHAYELAVPVNPRDYFEDLVTRCLKAPGVRATGLAGRRRGGEGDFRTVVEDACEALGLDGRVDRATRRAKAFDGGCDVLAYVPFEPRRRSVLVAVVQVTCARSDDWEQKLNQTAVSRWKKVLGSELSPVAVLAVPYHVDDVPLEHIEGGHQGALVLDRLFFATRLDRPGGMTDSDRRIAEALRRVEVEAPRGPARRDPGSVAGAR